MTLKNGSQVGNGGTLPKIPQRGFKLTEAPLFALPS
jgi:hypothetical protein